MSLLSKKVSKRISDSPPKRVFRTHRNMNVRVGDRSQIAKKQNNCRAKNKLLNINSIDKKSSKKRKNKKGKIP